LATLLAHQDAYTKNISDILFDPKSEGKPQLLSVNLNIPIPPDTVIISKIELQELNKLQLTGVYWSMKDLEERVS